MPDWRDEYLASLKDVELNNPVNMELVQACSQMADRISALEAEKVALQSRPPTTSTSKHPRPGGTPSDDAGIAQLRLDLAETLRAKGVAEARLRTAEEELGRLRAKTKEDARAVKDLTADRTSLIFRVKDREHELREKRKLLEQVQDEHIALNLQLSMAEKERDRVKKENKELVDRWMKRMGQEADAMNLANEPHLEKNH
ncbi:autophagy protein 16 (ATG16) domain-containing protein [Hirsutella rhossiliensis]|uniref:Autophagy protein 16 (ATG16) domain-containing protein n=1 Tax=Hirsutella rhossiliensis TaxID=111463 RepID=A0A9P8MQN5_9HYPO|nr:autophagy protein 16 (ATG16) domain-containing protein [Hirsutella rhossiliensis]KAH0959993.1 autophagy protein 16 (ATG16) domain-containing protein [Hirsutella rhossiliensis]